MIKLDGFADVGALAASLPTADERARAEAGVRQDSLTKPAGSLGRLEELAVFLAGWHGCAQPTIDLAQAIIFAGNHGVCAQGVSAFPQSVTAQMVANFEAGGAAVNQLCQVSGAELSVVALDLETPTADFTQQTAMSAQEVMVALNQGMSAVRADGDVVILGEMGIGNSTVAAALCAALFGGPIDQWVGRGTGADADAMARKRAAITTGLARHEAYLGEPLRILQAFGGREQAAICGAIMAARMHRIPVILDGFICCAAAGVLHAIAPTFTEHCMVGHMSSETGHRCLVEQLDKRPLLELDMRLGEGSGAALALSILRAAVACHNGMKTFAEAAVSNR